MNDIDKKIRALVDQAKALSKQLKQYKIQQEYEHEVYKGQRLEAAAFKKKIKENKKQINFYKKRRRLCWSPGDESKVQALRKEIEYKQHIMKDTYLKKTRSDISARASQKAAIKNEIRKIYNHVHKLVADKNT